MMGEKNIDDLSELFLDETYRGRRKHLSRLINGEESLDYFHCVRVRRWTTCVYLSELEQNYPRIDKKYTDCGCDEQH